MRWIRKRWALVAACIAAYFFAAHAGPNRVEFTFVLFLIVVILCGSAFVDRLSFDPSAIFIDKPWRILRPSAGDTFRLFALGIALAFLVLQMASDGFRWANSIVFEGAIVVLMLFIIELLKYSVSQVRWHGSAVSIRSRLGSSRTIRWNELVSVRRDRLGDNLEFRDISGNKFKINRYLRGYSEFVRDAERYCSPNVKMALKVAK